MAPGVEVVLNAEFVRDAGPVGGDAGAAPDGDDPVPVCANDAPAPTLRVTMAIMNKRMDDFSRLRGNKRRATVFVCDRPAIAWPQS